MSLSLELTDRVALITGGTRGIGAAIANLFATAGANVIITGTTQQALTTRVTELRDYGPGDMDGWQADFIEQPDDLERIRSRIQSLPQLDILVNNAGINQIAPIDEVKAQGLQKLMALNLQVPTILSGAAAAQMKARQWGRILNIASIWSVVSKPGRAMYTASKFGILGLTKACAVELGPDGILVNALSPGFTRTDLTNQTVPKDEQDHIAGLIPVRRFAEPREMAQTALFLCSNMNTYITGQNLVVDGGYVSV